MARAPHELVATVLVAPGALPELEVAMMARDLWVWPLATAPTCGDGPRFALLVHHTDAEREVAYDRESHVGRLVRGLDEGPGRGWTIVSMKDDWKRVFPVK